MAKRKKLTSQQRAARERSIRERAAQRRTQKLEERVGTKSFSTYSQIPATYLRAGLATIQRYSSNVRGYMQERAAQRSQRKAHNQTKQTKTPQYDQQQAAPTFSTEQYNDFPAFVLSASALVASIIFLTTGYYSAFSEIEERCKQEQSIIQKYDAQSDLYKETHAKPELSDICKYSAKKPKRSSYGGGII